MSDDQLTFTARPVWADDTIGVRFWEFHQAHPEVEAALIRLARQWQQARPGSTCGMKMLWERLRWEHAVGNLTGADFKLNNTFTAMYARWLSERPEFGDLFNLRARRCDR